MGHALLLVASALVISAALLMFAAPGRFQLRSLAKAATASVPGEVLVTEDGGERQADLSRALHATFEEVQALASRFEASTAGKFTIKRGVFHNFGLEDCNELTANNMTCFANNPSSPYGCVLLPPPKSEDEEDWSKCGGPRMPLCKTTPEGDKVGLPWHLNKAEAVVILGITPPEVRYFGFTNYLYERTFPDDFTIDDSVKPLNRCWGQDAPTRRCDIFASMGDSLNHGNLAPNETGKGVYNQPFAMVIAPSMTAFNETASLLKSSGIGVVNQLPLPGDFLNLGFEDNRDDFGTLLRTAFPTDAEAYKAWLDVNPFIVLRVTPTDDELIRIGSSGLKMYTAPRYCAVGGPSSGSEFCPQAVRQEWFDLGFTVSQDKGAGHLYLNCEEGASGEGLKASCLPEECGGKPWCFVPNHCNWCKEDPAAKLSCPAPVRSDYCLTPRSKKPEAERVGITTERLKEAQQVLLDAIKAEYIGGRSRWWYGRMTSITSFTAGVPDSGYGCLKLGQKCQGDSRDTYYPVSAELVQNALMRGAIHSKFWSALGWDPITKEEMAEWEKKQYKRATLTAKEDDVMVVVGVIHSATNASKYSSVSLYDLWHLQGVYAVSDSDLVGSADAYLKGSAYEDLAPYLYAMRYTRGFCYGYRFCKEVPVDGPLGIPESTPLLFIERMYYDPITHIGIDPSAAVGARMIHMALS